MNIISLGLKLLEDDHTLLVTHEDNLKDIRSSIDIALNILNDMLMYDKLQNTGLLLEKLYLSPCKYLLDTIEPMKVQVRNIKTVSYI